MIDDISLKRNKADYLLSITAAIQPALSIFQLFLMDVLHWEAEKANLIRVLSTAIPILLSMIVVVKRKPTLTIASYAVVLGLLATGFMIPGRWEYMSSDVLKFTIPVVVPIGLCIACIRNFVVLIKSMQYMSLIAAIIGILYGIMYLLGVVIIDNYSMSFSYSLLFPTFVFISRRHILWKCIAVVLMLEMLAIGSRGALLLSIVYWIFMMVWKDISIAKLILWIIALFAVYKLFFNAVVSFFADIFDTFGINSRTLRLLLGDELISHDSGRSDIYDHTWLLIDQAPLFGNGVWADRQYLGLYCHNVFLELFLDFGYIGAGLILMVLMIKQWNIFRKIPRNHKSIYIMMLGIVCPLFASSSYLISYNVGMFLGFSYLLSLLHNKQLYQAYIYE